MFNFLAFLATDEVMVKLACGILDNGILSVHS